jgi:hypothetical protein
MNINLDQALVEVNARKFLRMEKAAGTTLFCVSGSLWVTRDNCARDFELLPGDSYVAEGSQSLTVCGFEPSVARVFQPLPSRPLRSSTRLAALHRAVSSLSNAFAGLGWIKRSR